MVETHYACSRHYDSIRLLLQEIKKKGRIGTIDSRWSESAIDGPGTAVPVTPDSGGVGLPRQAFAVGEFGNQDTQLIEQDYRQGQHHLGENIRRRKYGRQNED